MNGFYGLQHAINLFFERFDTPVTLESIDEEDWDLLKVCIEAVEPMVTAPRLLGGEKYPTASSVIPFLDEVSPAPAPAPAPASAPAPAPNIFLCRYIPSSPRWSRIPATFLQKIQRGLKDGRRFGEDLYRSRPLFNILTALDGR